MPAPARLTRAKQPRLVTMQPKDVLLVLASDPKAQLLEYADFPKARLATAKSVERIEGAVLNALKSKGYVRPTLASLLAVEPEPEIRYEITEAGRAAVVTRA